jgi:hypothetical protein
VERKNIPHFFLFPEIMVPAHLAGAGARDSKPGGSGRSSGAGLVSRERMQSGRIRNSHPASAQVSYITSGNINLPGEQGDQIGRIFAHEEIVFFGQIFKN